MAQVILGTRPIPSVVVIAVSQIAGIQNNLPACRRPTDRCLGTQTRNQLGEDSRWALETMAGVMALWLLMSLRQLRECTYRLLHAVFDAADLCVAG